MKIIIETIPHKKQRYETVGDWIFDKDKDLKIYISNLKNWKMEALVAIHEFVESLLCKLDNIPEEVVCAYDIEFEKLRKKYPKIIGKQEPGNMTSSPYNSQHEFATQIEKLFAIKLKVNWSDYEKYIEKL